jgi:hypothetical protein
MKLEVKLETTSLAKIIVICATIVLVVVVVVEKL